MQYKKQEIREKILEAGRQEYGERGFREGNISTIATKSNVPVGNLYRYFDGKSGLLDAIVKPAFIEIPKAVKQMYENDDIDNMSIEDIIPILTAELLKIFDKYKSDILILVDRCATTRYEDFAADLIRLVDELICKKIYSNPTPLQHDMSNLISTGFMNAMFNMLRKNYSREQMEEMVNKILLFYFSDIKNRC